MNKNKIMSDQASNLVGTDIEVLKNLGIYHFGYREFLNDGSSIGFCTHQNWNLLENKPHIIEDMSDHYKKELLELGDDNIKYAAELLCKLYKKQGTWRKAVRYYHSATKVHHEKYSKKI